MSLIELIAGVEAHEKTLTAVNAAPEAVSDLRDHFADRNLSVVERSLDLDAKSFVVLSQDGEFLTAVAIDDLLEGNEETDPEFINETYRPILDHLDETVFTSYSIDDMVAASREIEDRAFRIGAGEIHSGFQTLDTLGGEMELYNRIAETSDLAVHAYAAPEGAIPEETNFTVHVERAPEIRNTWFVVYDGGGVDDNKCALLAEERGERSFYGFWSYDHETVDYMLSHLKSTYGILETDSETDGETDEVS